ncbi:PREDICTED: uncharacterized protein LOC106744358 [Dinoponera quadriceps]|uniref:Uncharacterized protein LOC106744358 n=1 Tax=Dinoponera quadriceps TaxID=609295 RepID=A0A6P3X8A4_DINQU|nr:PREDICTED: uncharacterized protein LOC106744358 [Dinoponera quadriceps]
MSEEKQNKESKKVTERVVTMGKSRGIAFKNEVVADNIRKETNLREKTSQRSWSRKYGHLTGKFSNEVLMEECRKAALPLGTFKRDPPEDAVERSPIPLKASPAVPKTSSAAIGHRSSRAEHSLEFTGRLYVSPRWTIEPSTDNPELQGAMQQQKFIFLG